MDIWTIIELVKFILITAFVVGVLVIAAIIIKDVLVGSDAVSRSIDEIDGDV